MKIFIWFVSDTIARQSSRLNGHEMEQFVLWDSFDILSINSFSAEDMQEQFS